MACGLIQGLDMPIYDCVEYAIGCETFTFRARTGKQCWEMFRQFVDTVSEDKIVKAYAIGLRPDYPIPVSRYFIEVDVDDEPKPWVSLACWTTVEQGRLKKGA